MTEQPSEIRLAARTEPLDARTKPLDAQAVPVAAARQPRFQLGPRSSSLAALNTMTHKSVSLPNSSTMFFLGVRITGVNGSNGG